MKKIIQVSSLLVVAFTLFAAKPASAHVYYPPYVYHGVWSGVPYGYGYFHLGYWPWGVTTTGWGYGYSYYPYYHYQPNYATYGAIVFSMKDDKPSYAWGYNSASEAVRAAKSYCTADDCRPVVWVQGGCAALVENKTENRMNWSYAADKYTAESTAMNACRQGGEKPSDCKTRAWVCSF